MVSWWVDQPYQSLYLMDVPLTYPSSRSVPIQFELNYKGNPGPAGSNDMAQPGIFGVGTNWHTPWRSYLYEADDSAVYIFLGDGSARLYYPDRHDVVSRALLLKTNSIYTLLFPDGSRNIYDTWVTLDGDPYAFLSSKQDALGNAMTFAYSYTTTTNGSVTNAIRLDQVTDFDSNTFSFSYQSNSGYYSNLITEVRGPYGLTNRMAYGANGRLTNITDVVGLNSGLAYGSGGRVSSLTTPYGTTTFTYYQTGNWNAMRVEELGVRNHLYLEGYDSSSIWPAATTESLSLSSYLATNGFASSVQTNGFSARNTFYWGPLQYQHLPSAIRTALTNQPSTFDPANLTTNDFQLGWTRHWLKGDGSGATAFTSFVKSMEREPSPRDDGATQGRISYYDYAMKEKGNDYEGSVPMPRVVATRSFDGDWHVRYKEYGSTGFGRQTAEIENWTRIGVDPYDPIDTYEVAWSTRQYVYESESGLGWLVEQWANGTLVSSNAYNADGQVITNFNALGEVTLFEYDGNKRLSRSTTPPGLVTEFSYDGTGFLAGTVESDADGNLRTNAYSFSQGLLATNTDPRGRVVTSTHDRLGRLLSVSDGAGVVSYTYTNLDLVQVVDRLGLTTRYVYDGFRQLKYQTNARAGVTAYQYCDCGSLTSVTDPGQNTTSFTYDNLGRRLRTTHPGGSWEEVTYAPSGEVLSTLDSAGVGVTNAYTINGALYSATSAFGRLFLRAFDDEGRVVRSVDANGVEVGMSYDAAGRLLIRTNAVAVDLGGSFFEAWQDRYDYTNNVSGPVASYREYVTAFLDGGEPDWTSAFRYLLGNHVVMAYDSSGRKTNEIHLGTTSVPLMTNAFRYTGAGDLYQLRDGKGQVTTWSYDAQGRVTNKTDHLGATMFGYSYDANGRLTNRWTPGGSSIVYSYDAGGNLLSVNYPTSPDLSFTYDANNRLVSMTDAVGTTTFAHTAFGALASEDGPWDGDTVSYSYTTNRLRGGMSVARMNAAAWTVGYAYDAMGRLTNVTSAAGAHGYGYHTGLKDQGYFPVPSPARMVRRLSLPGGAAVTNAFDDRARWTGTWLRTGSGTLLNQHLYEYDELDRRVSQGRGWEGAGTWTNRVAYGYDALHQLVSAVGTESGGTTNRSQEQFGYAYDAAGNLQHRTNNALVQSLTVNGLNQLSNATRSGTLTVAGATHGAAASVTVNGSAAERYADQTFARAGLTLADGTNTFTAVATEAGGRGATNTVTLNLPATLNFVYDARGNLRTNGTRVLEYDDENQLTRVTEPGMWQSEFVYDGKMRRRLRREYEWRNGAWVRTEEVRYVYDGNLVVQERDGLNVALVAYTRGPDLSGTLEGAGGIGGLLARTELTVTESAAEHVSYGHDGNGNVTCLLDGETVVGRYQYDPFGNTLTATGPAAEANLYRFSSKELHPASGLIYYLYRFYDPSVQRWPNRDPIEEDGGINLYGFVGNDSIDKADLYGLTSIPGREGDESNCLGGALTGARNYYIYPDNRNPSDNFVDAMKKRGWKCTTVSNRSDCKCDCKTEDKVLITLYNNQDPRNRNKNPWTDPSFQWGGRDSNGNLLTDLHAIRGIKCTGRFRQIPHYEPRQQPFNENIDWDLFTGTYLLCCCKSK